MHLIYKFIDISMVILHYTMNNSIKDLLKKRLIRSIQYLPPPHTLVSVGVRVGLVKGANGDVHKLLKSGQGQGKVKKLNGGGAPAQQTGAGSGHFEHDSF